MPSPARSCPSASLSRLARRVGTPGPAAWSPPPLPDLIGRIDAALATRRGVASA